MALTAEQIFQEKIAQKLKDNADKLASMKAIYEFKVTGGAEEVWTLDLSQPGGAISKGSSGKAQCTVTIAASDLSDIVEKKLNPQMAFMSGKLKVAGDMGLTLKLGNVL